MTFKERVLLDFLKIEVQALLLRSMEAGLDVRKREVSLELDDHWRDLIDPVCDDPQVEA